uniref:ribosomal protein S2 n=1 Tax=Coelastrella saipanensis TaxID=152631 RepID=UPI0010C4FD70|nr:ribosomal protein S2 [Coelastrella saipanensis]AVV61564.1 ribosomal protein S2 [Coelastrella saipanensis]
MENRDKNLTKQKSRVNFSKTQRERSFLNKERNYLIKQNLKPGDILTVKINALGSKNIGVAELKNGYTVLVPNTKCGEKVQVKVEKIVFPTAGKNLNSFPNQKIKYVIARLENSVQKGSNFEQTANSLKFDFQVGQKLKVKIAKKGPKNSGLVPISKNFVFIVPNTKVGEKVIVEIQKIKQNYAFAKPISSPSESMSEKTLVQKQLNTLENLMYSKNANIGQQFHIVIPSSAKTVSNYFVLKVNGRLVFVKKSLGVQIQNTVKIQIQKATKNFALAKILKISPISSVEKKSMEKESLQKMISSSMHFGEKAIRCNANMRKYIWYRKNYNMYQNSFSKEIFSSEKGGNKISATKKPMMKRGRHILNVLKTQRCFHQALKQLAKYAAKGKTFLFVGTKKPASSLIAKTALLSNTAFFVNTRWLGGMLTNWKTILKSISQIRPILKQKQKILQKILEKRQKIQRRLFNKVSFLRKKSQKFMMKGKYLIRQILISKNFLIERSKKLFQTKNTILSSNMILLNASKKLKMKKMQILKQMQQLELSATEILKQKQQLKNLMLSNITKFDEISQFFAIGQELVQLKNSLETKGNKQFVAISYEKLLTMKESSLTEQNSTQLQQSIPNPSQELFKKMISIVSTLRKEDIQFVSAVHGDNSTTKNSNRSKSNEKLEETNVHESTSRGAKQNKTILLSKFLTKFILFLPYLKNSMQILSLRFHEQEKMLAELNSTFAKIVESQNALKQLYKKIVSQLSIVFAKFMGQKQNFQKFQKNLKQFTSEERLLKFLPKLRYLPTSQTKMYETVELFMKKFVDPKLSYPMEQIYDQKLKFTSKKIAATRKQKWQRLEKYFGGITKMAKMNTKQISKNVAIIIGQQEEMNAVYECRKLGMKIFTVVDTNCNPKLVDHIIPANDDSRNSIKYILGEMLTYIRLGQKLRRKVLIRAKLQNMKKRRFTFSSSF